MAPAAAIEAVAVVAAVAAVAAAAAVADVVVGADAAAALPAAVVAQLLVAPGADAAAATKDDAAAAVGTAAPLLKLLQVMETKKTEVDAVRRVTDIYIYIYSRLQLLKRLFCCDFVMPGRG